MRVTPVRLSEKLPLFWNFLRDSDGLFHSKMSYKLFNLGIYPKTESCAPMNASSMCLKIAINDPAPDFFHGT